jgi:hypothetical protein
VKDFEERPKGDQRMSTRSGQKNQTRDSPPFWFIGRHLALLPILFLLIAIFVLISARVAYALDNGGVFFPDRLFGLNGIATDNQGNVFVHFDRVHTTTLLKFSPEGQLLATADFGGINISEFVGSRLDRDPQTGSMFLLSPQGQIFIFDPKPNQIQAQRVIDLRPLAGNTDNSVYDVVREENRPFVLGLPTYNDIAIRRVDSNQFDLFVSGFTSAAGAFPFVMRIRVNEIDNSVSTDIVLTSGTLAVSGSGPPGIAVNQDGMVLTTMPNRLNLQALVTFGADFVENPSNSSLRPKFLFTATPGTTTGIQDIQSSGMTTDLGGNFYVATGVLGTTWCVNQGSGALLFIPRNLLTFTCLQPLTSPIDLLRARDVAVSPSGDRIYLTVVPGQIVVFGQAPLPGTASQRNYLDVDGDGKADLVWQNMSTGDTAIWLMEGTVRKASGSPGGAPLAWQVAGRGDVDGDGKSDLIWRHTMTGSVAVWLMNGTTRTVPGFPGVAPLEWAIEGVGDLNGDGKADLVWRNTNSGAVAVWFMNGTTRASADFPPGVPLAWQIAGVGDVDGDGKADLIWRHAANGAVAVWLMNGPSIRSPGFPGGAPLEWTIKGVGDVDGDGKADLIWKNDTSKAVAIWLMNGGSRVASGVVDDLLPDWELEQVGDTNGDGKADVITRNTVTGAVGVWLLDGVNIIGTGSPGSFSTDWKIQK